MTKCIKLILIIICMGIIFYFSSDNAVESTKKSDNVIIRVSNFFSSTSLTAREQQIIIQKLVVPVRKGAHFLIYLILGGLIVSFLDEFSISERKMILLAVFLSFLYACSDEIHQMFVPGRSGQISDVLLDTVGSIVGIYVYLVIIKIFGNNKNRLLKERRV